MRVAYLACLCSGLTVTFAQSLTPSTNAVAVTGFASAGGRTRYTVAASELPCRVSWDAEVEPFPKELHTLVTRATSVLDKAWQLGGTHGNTSFDLDDILIKRIGLAGKEAQAGETDQRRFTNQWFVAVTFYGTDPFDATTVPPVALKHVVMLLDGTCATEEEDPFARPRWSISSSPGASGNSNSPTRNVPRSAWRHPGLYGMLSRPDFPISEVQWDPAIQAFPLDLQAQTRRAKEQVESTARPQCLSLTEIHLWRYTPTGALKAANEPRSKHLHHWEAVFWFRGNDGQEYDVHMLLNTTILTKDGGFLRR